MVGCFGLNLDWANRTDMQKVAFVISVIVVLGALMCVIANISIAVEGDKGNWFKDDTQQRVFFFILRSYAIIFSAIVMVAEFHVVHIINTYAKMFRFFWVRGALQIFVGMLTIAGDFSPPGDSSAAKALAAIGWVLVAIGAVHFILACCCFKEYSAALKQGDLNEMAPGAQIDRPPPSGNANSNTNTSATPTVATQNPYPSSAASNDIFGPSDAGTSGNNYRI